MSDDDDDAASRSPAPRSASCVCLGVGFVFALVVGLGVGAAGFSARVSAAFARPSRGVLTLASRTPRRASSPPVAAHQSAKSSRDSDSGARARCGVRVSFTTRARRGCGCRLRFARGRLSARAAIARRPARASRASGVRPPFRRGRSFATAGDPSLLPVLDHRHAHPGRASVGVRVRLATLLPRGVVGSSVALVSLDGAKGSVAEVEARAAGARLAIADARHRWATGATGANETSPPSAREP